MSAKGHRRLLVKAALFGLSLFLFALAINLMKEGAHALAPLIQDRFHVDNVANSVGFGWLAAYLLMSGSPVAAAALAFFDAGVINDLQTFGMISGSRFGASFIVLLVGALYVLRGRDRATSLSMGLLSLGVTDATYAMGMLVGMPLLASGVLAGLRLDAGARAGAVLDGAVGPVVTVVASALPGWATFVVGLGTALVSFALFDRCLPEVSVKESSFGQVSTMVYNRWAMLLLGAAVTLVSMSVSLSLSILVPLSDRGIIRRENVIPYIMGANITTFVDTLLAAVLLRNPPAFTIVLAEMISISLVSFVVLAFSYRRFERGMLGFVDWTTRADRHLAAFLVAILALPLLLLLVP